MRYAILPFLFVLLLSSQSYATDGDVTVTLIAGRDHQSDWLKKEFARDPINATLSGCKTILNPSTREWKDYTKGMTLPVVVVQRGTETILKLEGTDIVDAESLAEDLGDVIGERRKQREAEQARQELHDTPSQQPDNVGPLLFAGLCAAITAVVLFRREMGEASTET